MKSDSSNILYIRVSFWLIGLLVGSLTAYTGRYFQNNDAMVYIEMGEAFWAGRWWDIANFTFSPLYAAIVGIFQRMVRTNPDSEIMVLKLLNVGILVFSMASYECFMSAIKRAWIRLYLNNENPLDWASISAVCYSVFLVAALVSVRTRLLNPDMLVMAILFICFAIITSASQGLQNYSKFVSLGLGIGFGYLTKAFFFLYSPALILFAGLSCDSIKRALPRCLVAIAVAVIISGPLLIGLSIKKGSFSYGEGGRHVYAILFGSTGQPIYPGVVLNQDPKTVAYEYGDNVTRPLTFDVSYWTIGVQPNLKIPSLIILFWQNFIEFFVQSPWIFFVAVWFLLNVTVGSFKISPIVPASSQLINMGLGILGVALFCLVSVEPRYVAPFVCCFCVGLCLAIRTKKDSEWIKKLQRVSSYGLALILVFFVIHSAIDQSYRGLVSSFSKASYKEAFEENFAIKELLERNGINPGDKVSVIGSPPTQWARMAGLRITGEILFQDEFVNASSAQRLSVIKSLKKSGYKAVIAIGREYHTLIEEGWTLVPGTRNFYVHLL